MNLIWWLYILTDNYKLSTINWFTDFLQNQL